MICGGGSSISSSLGSVLTICLLTSSLISGWYWCFNNSESLKIFHRGISRSYFYLSKLLSVQNWYQLHIFRQRPKMTGAIKLVNVSFRFGISRNGKPKRPIHGTAKRKGQVCSHTGVKFVNTPGHPRFKRTRAYFFSIRTRRKSELTPL